MPTTQHIIHLERCFGPLKFVYIRREDVVAQAVSWARAEQTKVWHRTHASDPVQHESPQYSFDLIDTCFDQIVDHNQRWVEWFHDNSIEQIPIIYEELVSAPKEMTLQLLEQLGIPYDDGDAIKSSNLKMADSLSEAWITRYIAEKDA